MARIARQTPADVSVAYVSIHAPDYTLIVDTTSEASALPDGWVYTKQDIEPDDLIPYWAQPTGAHDAYVLDAEVLHGDKRWLSTVADNVWEPGVSGWREVAAEGEHPAWAQPTGAHDAYPRGFVVFHSNETWRTEREANVWEPGTPDAGWVEIVEVLPPAGEQTWADTGATITQLVGAGTYRVSAVVTLAVGQALRLGDTAETVFNGYWPTAATPSDYLTIAPHVAAAVGSKVWKWG